MKSGNLGYGMMKDCTWTQKAKEFVLSNFLQSLHAVTLKVVGVRYFDTRRGLGYECETNYAGIKIWNDGNGGQTYIDPPKAYKLLDLDFCPHAEWQQMGEPELKPDGTPYTKWDVECLCDVDEDVKIEPALDRLIDDYEGTQGKKTNDPWVCESKYRKHIVHDKFPAISRVDNKTHICSECGQDEAMEDYANYLDNSKIHAKDDENLQDKYDEAEENQYENEWGDDEEE